MSPPIPKGLLKPLRGFTKRYLGILISIACFSYLVSKTDIESLFIALSDFGWTYVLPAFLCIAFGYSIRIYRWHRIIHKTGTPISRRQCISPFLASIALNNLLPLRLGDVLRALVFPVSMNIPRTVATGSIVLERILDLFAVLFYFGLGIAFSQDLLSQLHIGDLAFKLSSLGCVGLLLLFFLGRPLNRKISALRTSRIFDKVTPLKRLFEFIVQTFSSLAAVSNPVMLSQLAIISIFVWLGEAGLFFFAFVGAGFHIDVFLVLLVMSIAALATLIPSSPGYVGPFHLAIYFTLSITGLAENEAAELAIILHAILWVGTTVPGVIAIVANPNLFSLTRDAIVETKTVG